MKQIFANNFSILQLGRQGENLARQVVFDLSDWISGYGDGVAELIAQRPGDERPYPVEAVREGSTLVWTVSKSDTAVVASYGSFGRCELRWYVGDVLVKSKTWQTLVDPAMDTPSETAPPELEQGWVEQVIAVGAAAKASADAAKDAQKDAEAARDRAETAVTKQPIPNADTGTWWVWDTSTGAYIDSGEKANGKDGKSAYQAAQDGGYTGTEQAFNTDLASVSDKYEKPSTGIPKTDLASTLQYEINSKAKKFASRDEETGLQYLNDNGTKYKVSVDKFGVMIANYQPPTEDVTDLSLNGDNLNFGKPTDLGFQVTAQGEAYFRGNVSAEKVPTENSHLTNKAYVDSKLKEIGGGGTSFRTDETLSLKDGVLSVNTAQEPEPDNTLPITSAAVHKYVEDALAAANAIVSVCDTAPEATEDLRGRLIIVPKDGKDVLMICMLVSGAYQWVSLTGAKVDVDDTQPILGTAKLGTMKLA